MPSRINRRNSVSYDGDCGDYEVTVRQRSQDWNHTKKKSCLVSSNKNRKPQSGRRQARCERRRSISCSSSDSRSSTRTTSSTTSESSKTKKSVDFHKIVKVQKVLHILDYSSTEHDATWYNSSELMAMKHEMKQMVVYVETFGIKKCCQVNSDFSIRGIEYHLEEYGKQQRLNRIKARQIVLEEQQGQRLQNNGIVINPDLIAFQYMSETRQCLVMAQEVGMDDEYVAKQLYRPRRRLQ